VPHAAQRNARFLSCSFHGRRGGHRSWAFFDEAGWLRRFTVILREAIFRWRWALVKPIKPAFWRLRSWPCPALPSCATTLVMLIDGGPARAFIIGGSALPGCRGAHRVRLGADYGVPNRPGFMRIGQNRRELMAALLTRNNPDEDAEFFEELLCSRP